MCPQVRTWLLKEGYRLGAEGHAELLERCATVAARLGITAPVTLYQSIGRTDMNAALYYLPGEAHIVFSGATLGTLRAQNSMPSSRTNWRITVSGTCQRGLSGCGPSARCRERPSRSREPRTDRPTTPALHGDLCRSRRAGRLRSVRCFCFRPGENGDRLASGQCGQLPPAGRRDLATDDRQAKGWIIPEIYIRARAFRLWSDRMPV